MYLSGENLSEERFSLTEAVPSVLRTSPNRSDDHLSALLTSPYTVGSYPAPRGVTPEPLFQRLFASNFQPDIALYYR